MPDDLTTIFGKNLTRILESKGLTQQWVVNKMNVSASTVSDWCNGKKAPRMNRIQILADLLNVDVSCLTSADVTDDDLTDQDRLEALHQNPRLGMLFDRTRKMSKEDVDFMLQLAERILRERDGQ